jgi:hypothetical protein
MKGGEVKIRLDPFGVLLSVTDRQRHREAVRNDAEFRRDGFLVLVATLYNLFFTADLL